MKYYEDDVDKWVEENGDDDAWHLLDECLPKHRAKLERLDKQIIKVLAEINEVFPDAQYYTASGGFTLMLGDTHENGNRPQQQRMCWLGSAYIGDGDF